MTEDTLKEIEGRLRAATYGPWNRSTFGNQVLTGDSEQTICWLRSHFNENLINDADFIAHAREDVSLLMAEVRRLRAENERTQTRLDNSRSANALRQRRLDAAVADRDRLRKALRHHGQHDPVCPMNWVDEYTCTCGLWDALEVPQLVNQPQDPNEGGKQ